jgi:hypothetical protein
MIMVLMVSIRMNSVKFLNEGLPSSFTFNTTRKEILCPVSRVKAPHKVQQNPLVKNFMVDHYHGR